jgi:2-iminobutanoate/2-iminopropanoate deaminase
MITAHNPLDAPAPSGGYAQGLEVATPGRLLLISGQIPVAADGSLTADFEAQCHQVWRNLVAVLRSADMRVIDLVKVTTFLSDRRHRDANSEIRRHHLGAARPALTVIITGIYDDAWLLEIEALAFAASLDGAAS